MKHDFLKTQFDAYSERELDAWLKPLGFTLKRSQELANAVLKLSDLYTSGRGSPDVWAHPAHVAAYLVYFMPLNHLRCQYVIAKTSAQILVSTAIDYGAGLGAFSLALLNAPELKDSLKKIVVYEPSSIALELSQKILKPAAQGRELVFVNTLQQMKRLEQLEDKGVTYCLSYSLNEMSEFDGPNSNDPNSKVESLLIVEPSTQTAGRALQNYRADLLKSGFTAWAPCLHQEECPLLKHSKADWCHTRFHIEMPSWFMDIEKYLPMKNQSVTLSYLSASRQAVTASVESSARSENTFRIIGDTLFEKGKTRQAVCRNSNREFFSWLTKNSEAPLLPRGEVVQVESTLVKKGDELRAEDEFSYSLK